MISHCVCVIGLELLSYYQRLSQQVGLITNISVISADDSHCICVHSKRLALKCLLQTPVETLSCCLSTVDLSLGNAAPTDHYNVSNLAENACGYIFI